MRERMQKAALRYAENGWPVFPVEPGGKAPIGRLVPNGVKNASTDGQKIRDRWSVVPSANIGVATGSIFVADLDVKGEADGLAAWEELTKGREVPETLTVRTPSGGRHYYYRAPAGIKIPNDNHSRLLGPGIDVKGHGGYVVAPPSSTDVGTYEVIKKRRVADAPPWLIEKLTAASTNGRAERAAPVEGDIPEGQRNGTLTSLAGSMRRRGMSETAMFAALMEENRARCRPPLPEDEVRRIAASVARYEPTAEVTEEKETEAQPPDYVPFPLEALPTAAADYVRACTKAIGCVPAMTALPLLAAMSAAVGSAARLKLKRSWREPATIWTSLVAPSGSAKTPALKLAIRPVYRREREAKESYEQALAEYEKAKEESEEPQKPKRRRYRTGDATPESVMRLLGENERGLLLVRNEQGAWYGSFDRYAQGAADMQFWIEVWDGQQASRDRVTENVTVDRPSVSVTGTIQPGTLKEKLTELHFESGFEARFLHCMPPTHPLQWTEADVTKEVEDDFEQLLDGLYSVPMDTEVELTPEAKKLWVGFYNRANEEAAELEGPAKAAYIKGVSYGARLALILHLAEVRKVQSASGVIEPVEPIADVSGEIMQRALILAKWLRNETLRVYEVLGLAEKVLPPEQRFLSKLPEEFETKEAEALADDFDVTARTVRNWLNELTGAGDIEKIRRGLYRKISPVSSFRNFRSLHKDPADSGPSVKKAEAKENGNGESTPGGAERNGHSEMLTGAQLQLLSAPWERWPLASGYYASTCDGRRVELYTPADH